MPFMLLLGSRKFWLLILDTVVSMLLFFGGKFLGPDAFESVKFLIVALQPVFVFLITAIAIEDAAEKRAGTFRGTF